MDCSNPNGAIRTAKNTTAVVWGASLSLSSPSPQMFEHSQALQAHNQHQQQLDHTPSSSQQETSFNPATSQLHGSVSRASRQNSGGGGGITQDQLASALASAMGSSPVASINHSQLNYRCKRRKSTVVFVKCVGDSRFRGPFIIMQLMYLFS